MPEPITGTPSCATEYAFLQRLKTATVPQHAALEAQPLLQALMTPAINRKQYLAYLLHMQKVTQAYEQAIIPLLATVAPKQLSSALIEEDLQQLFSFKDQLLSLPHFALPQSVTLPFAWGFAYVMEGSKLGGRVIFKHLQKNLRITEETGGAYLANKGADTGPEWKEFLQNLSAYTKAHSCEEEVLCGAIFGFTAIHDYFEANRQAHDD